jgi:hypothetical protein
MEAKRRRCKSLLEKSDCNLQKELLNQWQKDVLLIPQDWYPDYTLSELNYAQSKDRSKATRFLLRPRIVTAIVLSPGSRNTQFPRFRPSDI